MRVARPLSMIEPSRALARHSSLYLASAAFVLTGMLAWSNDLARAGLAGVLGVAWISELYAYALIGAAALLFRIEERRSAVVLAVLAFVYQGDLMLHTETCTNLGNVGIGASVAWLAVFVVKLRVLLWAVRVTIPRAWWIASLLAGVGLAALPYLLSRIDPRLATSIAAVWLAGIVSAVHFGKRESSRVEQRVFRALFAIGGALLLLHVGFWALERWIEPSILVALVPFGAMRNARERSAWAFLAVVLGALAIVLPSAVVPASGVTAVVLFFRAATAMRADIEAIEDASPYRASAHAIHAIDLPDVPAARRYFVGAIASLVGGGWVLGEGERWRSTLASFLPSTRANAGSLAIAVGFVLLLTLVARAYFGAREKQRSDATPPLR